MTGVRASSLKWKGSLALAMCCAALATELSTTLMIYLYVHKKYMGKIEDRLRLLKKYEERGKRGRRRKRT
jgi:hypothetical protein